VVTFGLTRRLIEADNQPHARELFVEGASPLGGRLKVASHEIFIREATDDDLREFYPRRGAHQLRKANEQLFDVDTVAPKQAKPRTGNYGGHA
jgi:hypothetical protein